MTTLLAFAAGTFAILLAVLSALVLDNVKLKEDSKLCGRYANVAECTRYPCCDDCPYKKDKV